MQRLDGSTTLADGQRLRLRMPQGADAPRLRELLAGLGLGADDLELSRILRFDPRDRVAVVATVLADRCEVLVGLAAMDRYASAPDLVLADERLAPGTGAILEDTLRAYTERARRIA
jgi:hypothetical protein